MAFVDEYSFRACAGKGGDGVVRWRREKFRPKGGPAGGDGGKGGDFYVEGIRDIMQIGRISHKDSYRAQDGFPGGDNSKTGANGADFILQLPVGSRITNKNTGNTYEILMEGERVLLLHGGEGGLGNEYFKSATNQAPMHATKGKEGECAEFFVELRLIADVGLVGLPNAGKTSLLNALTRANAKVGAYPFTTIDPNLGVYQKYILADIPGLIEGAREGKGLGIKFLRHIARTNVILHCISLERDNPVQDYHTIRKELAAYPEIIEKKEYVLLTKKDTVNDDEVKKIQRVLKKEVGNVMLLGAVTILDDQSIKKIGDNLVRVLNENDA